MKDKIYKIASVVSCILLVVSYMKITELESKINNLNTAISRTERSLENSMSSIYSNVDRMLREEASLLLGYECNIISGNVAEKTVQLEIAVKPKEYSPAATQAAVTVNGVVYPMDFAGDRYIAAVTVPMLEYIEVETVSFTENGTVRSREINWGDTPRYDYLTTVYGDFGLSQSTANRKDNNIHMAVNSVTNISAERKGTPAKIEKVELVQITDGKEVNRQTLEENDVTKGGRYPEKAPAVNGEDWNTDVFSCVLEHTFIMPYGSSTYIWAEVTDAEGMLHRCLMVKWRVSTDGNDVEDPYGWYSGAEAAEVYNTDGTLLYSIETEDGHYKW